MTHGIATAHVRVLNSGGCEVQSQGLDFSVQKNASGQWVSPIERFEFSDGSVRTLDDLLIKTRVTEGSSKQTVLTTGRDDDVIYAGPRTDTIRTGSGHDVVFASSGGDLAYGEGGDDYLQGGTGDDVLEGGCGTDVLSGSNGQDQLFGGGGNDALLGGHQRDSLDGGEGNDFLAGGKHDDTLWTGDGYNVIAFNQGDGRDTVHATAGSSNTLSLGGGIREQDLALAKLGNDLVLSAGGNNQITFKDWYASPTQQTLSTLQLVESVDSTASGWAIDTYDFKALVQSFDVSRQASSSNWSLTNHLLNAHLANEDRAAWGGELATRHAVGGESALSLDGTQNTLSHASFAVQAQGVGSRFNPSMGNFQLN